MVLLLIPIRAGSKAQPLLAHAPTDPSPRREKQLRVLWDAPVESCTHLCHQPLSRCRCCREPGIPLGTEHNRAISVAGHSPQ